MEYYATNGHNDAEEVEKDMGNWRRYYRCTHEYKFGRNYFISFIGFIGFMA